MPYKCVAAGCSNEPNSAERISCHFIPFWKKLHPEAKRRRKRWVDFVDSKRANFHPTKKSVICSKHFLPEDFNRRFATLEPEKPHKKRTLRRDDFGICVWPTHTIVAKEQAPMSSRTRRKVTYTETLHFFQNISFIPSFGVIY